MAINIEKKVKSKNNSDYSKMKIGIIGAGAAGLTAGLVGARHGLKCVIFEAKTAGGRVGGIPYIESFPGLGRMKGTEFVKKLKVQIQEYPNIELHEFEPVKKIKIEQNYIKLGTEKDEYIFKNVILAMGAEHKPINVPGEKEFKGRGVSYCAACDGLFFREKNTVVIGNDSHALEQALFLDELKSNVTLINPENNWNAELKLVNDLQKTTIRVLQKATVEEIFGERMVSGIKVTGSEVDTKSQKMMETMETIARLDLEAKGVFISIGWEPRIELVLDLGIVQTSEGYLKVNENYQTNKPNIYAIGDITNGNLELVSVCASGANAVRDILKEK